MSSEDFDNNRIFTWHQTSARPTSTGDHNSTVIRKGNFKLHYFLDDQKIELYDLSKDPYEKDNIADENPEITKNLMQLMKEWKTDAKVSSPKKRKK